MTQNTESRVEIPLCVDLDGTLIRTDLIIESLFQFLRRHPLKFYCLFFWALKGRPYFKQKLAEGWNLKPDLLPYHEDVLTFARNESRKRPVYLATGSVEPLAHSVAHHLGFFSGVFSTNSMRNLTGSNKAQVLADQFGERQFDYIGNSWVDLAVWKRSARAYVFSRHASLIKAAEKMRGAQDLTVMTPALQDSKCKSMIKAIRPHQWVKNLLVFIPVLAAHKIGDAELLLKSVFAFASFSFLASSTYLVNDLLDLDSDRRHPQKKYRPFASGTLSVQAGLFLWMVLVVLGIGLAWFLPFSFLMVLLIYTALSMTYSFSLKRIVLLDVFTLAALYTIRIIAGHEATEVKYSYWLLSFAIFFFFSLALVKRNSELKATLEENKALHGRGYSAEDQNVVLGLGISSGFLAILILSLYLNSQEVLALYHRPMWIWPICPLMVYWVSRIWVLSNRNELHHDPIVFALKDRTSYLIGVVILVLGAFATMGS